MRRPAGVRTRNFLAENQAICQLDLPAHGETGAVSAAPVAAPADATGRGLDRARLSLLRCPARDRMQVRINRWRAWVCGVLHSPHNPVSARCNARAHHRDRTGDLRIFGPTLKPAELGGHGSYRVGLCLLQRGDRPRGGWSLLPILTDTEFQGMPTPGWTVVAASASCPVDSGRCHKHRPGTPASGPGCDALPLVHPFLWSLTVSNRRPPACHAGALPAELRPQMPAAVRYWYLPRLRPLGPLSAGFPGGVAAACGAAAGVKGVCQDLAGLVVAPDRSCIFMPFPLWNSQVLPCPCPRGSAGDEQGRQDLNLQLLVLETSALPN